MPLSRANLVLAGVILVLAGILILDPGSGAPDAVIPLTELRADAVRDIRIRPSAGGEIHMRRARKGWQMSIPYALPADSDRLGRLARLSETRSWRRIPVTGLDLAGTGLNTPLGVELNGEVLEMGGTEPVRGRRYVRRGDQVHLIDDLFHHLLSASALLEHRPFPEPIDRARLNGTDLPAASLVHLARARALRVEEQGLAGPALELEVRSSGEPQPRLFLLSPEGSRLGRLVPPLTYVLEQSIPPAVLTDSAEP